MSPETINQILVAGAVAGILLLVLALIDFFINRWKYFKMFVHWCRKQILRFKIDPAPVALNIPPEAPITTTSTPDGVHKTQKIYIFRGTQQQLIASEITRDGFPGTRYLVEYIAPNQTPKSITTPNPDEANTQWNKWYKEWQKQPGGFGGSFGNGMDGRPPW